MNDDPKSLLASRTIWGILIAGVGQVLPLIGVTLSPADISQATDILQQVGAIATQAITVGGLALAWYGRVKATKVIGKAG